MDESETPPADEIAEIAAQFSAQTSPQRSNQNNLSLRNLNRIFDVETPIEGQTETENVKSAVKKPKKKKYSAVSSPYEITPSPYTVSPFDEDVSEPLLRKTTTSESDASSQQMPSLHGLPPPRQATLLGDLPVLPIQGNRVAAGYRSIPLPPQRAPPKPPPLIATQLESAKVFLQHDTLVSRNQIYQAQQSPQAHSSTNLSSFPPLGHSTRISPVTPSMLSSLPPLSNSNPPPKISEALLEPVSPIISNAALSKIEKNLEGDELLYPIVNQLAAPLKDAPAKTDDSVIEIDNNQKKKRLKSAKIVPVDDEINPAQELQEQSPDSIQQEEWIPVERRKSWYRSFYNKFGKYIISAFALFVIAIVAFVAGSIFIKQTSNSGNLLEPSNQVATTVNLQNSSIYMGPTLSEEGATSTKTTLIVLTSAGATVTVTSQMTSTSTNIELSTSLPSASAKLSSSNATLSGVDATSTTTSTLIVSTLAGATVTFQVTSTSTYIELSTSLLSASSQLSSLSGESSTSTLSAGLTLSGATVFSQATSASNSIELTTSLPTASTQLSSLSGEGTTSTLSTLNGLLLSEATFASQETSTSNSIELTTSILSASNQLSSSTPTLTGEGATSTLTTSIIGTSAEASFTSQVTTTTTSLIVSASSQTSSSIQSLTGEGATSTLTTSIIGTSAEASVTSQVTTTTTSLIVSASSQTSSSSQSLTGEGATSTLTTSIVGISAEASVTSQVTTTTSSTDLITASRVEGAASALSTLTGLTSAGETVTPQVTSTSSDIGLTTSLISVSSTPTVTNFYVSALAGSSQGYADGSGANVKFNSPLGLAVDSSRNIYVGDGSNNLIRKITASGIVTTLAGNATASGSTDGVGTNAKFFNPYGVAVDSSGNVYVADGYNNLIRKITASGNVTTLAGTAGVTGSTNGIGTNAKFYNPFGVAVDSSGNVYVVDTGNHLIPMITASGNVSTFAGSSQGSTNGVGTNAKFNFPRGIAVDSSDNVYVADTENHLIRKITASGTVTTLAGTAGTAGSTNGEGTNARFNFPRGIAVDSSGNVYVADTNNHLIRKITSSGTVTTFAGTTGTTGSTNGVGTSVKFNFPRGVAVDSSGNVYVGDTDNHLIRKIAHS